MKFICNFAIAISMIVLVSYAQAMTNEEAKEMLKSISEECRKAEGASEEEVEKLAEREYPTTKEGKCMIHCLQEQFGVTEESVYQRDNVKNLALMFAGDDENKKNAVDEIADECKNEIDPDKCEQAIKIAKCLQVAGEKRGFKAPGEE